MIRFACPQCRSVFDRPNQDAGQKIACPGCGQRLEIPTLERQQTLLGEAIQQESSRPKFLPATGNDSVPPPPPPLNPASPGWENIPYRPHRPLNDPSIVRAGFIGFNCALMSLLTLAGILVLWIFMTNFGWRPPRERLLLILLLTMGSFTLGVLAVVFSARGLAAENPSRGYAITGLTCGISGIVFSFLAGVFFTCLGSLFARF